MPTADAAPLITGCDTREYFHHAVSRAAQHRGLEVEGETLIYVVNLLTLYVRSERLYDMTADGPAIPPLAELYGEAVHADSAESRDRSLRRLGDLALFVSGFFSQSLGRRLVDVDYYIEMGGRAYGFLAESMRVSRTSTALRDVFSELAYKFSGIAEALSGIGENFAIRTSGDALRLYEIWQCSGNRAAAERLRAIGIEPVPLMRRAH